MRNEFTTKYTEMKNTRMKSQNEHADTKTLLNKKPTIDGDRIALATESSSNAAKHLQKAANT